MSDQTSAEWYVGFEDEEYPDLIVVGEGERLVARVIDSNIIPLPDLNDKTQMVDTEVLQVEILDGTDVRDKEFDSEGRQTPLDTFVQVGDTRSFWINSFLLVKNVKEWNLGIGDEFAVFNKGKVKGRNREYHKVMMTVKGKQKYKKTREDASR